MKLKRKVTNNVIIITVTGNMMGGEDSQKFHDEIKEILREGYRYILLDLGKVKWMNSSGIGTLMSSWGSVSQKEGILKLANVTNKIESLLVITQLIQFFETFESVDRAVASFPSK
jgi:anti-sigma B factor antagonist